MAVARQESFQPEDVGVAVPADDDRAAGAGLDQADPPQDQRAHDPLAELRLGDEQGAQPVRRDHQRLDLAQRMGVDQRRLARQLGELADEGARAVGDDELARVAVPAVPGDVDLAGQDQGQSVAALAGTHQHVAVGESAKAAEAPKPLDFRRRQRRIHLRTAAVVDRRRQFGAGRGVGHGYGLGSLHFAGKTPQAGWRRY